MGRKTWDLLPVKPLPNCFNVVLTNKCILVEDSKPHLILSSINDCLYYLLNLCEKTLLTQIKLLTPAGKNS